MTFCQSQLNTSPSTCTAVPIAEKIGMRMVSHTQRKMAAIESMTGLRTFSHSHTNTWPIALTAGCTALFHSHMTIAAHRRK